MTRRVMSQAQLFVLKIEKRLANKIVKWYS